MAMTARVNYTVTPNLSIQLYAQPFGSAEDYSRYAELWTDARAATMPAMRRFSIPATRTSFQSWQ